MNYEYYKIFYVVGKHKNITRAAEELYSSQPAVTRVIQNMETELACKLFTRTKSGVVFTREGKNLFNLISKPCSTLLHVDADLTQNESLKKNTIHIGATITAMYCFLFDFLKNSQVQFPDIRFNVITGASSKLLERLKNGDVDLVFNTTPFNLSEKLSVTKIQPFNDILIGGENFNELKGTTVSISDLENYPFILLSQERKFRQFIDEFLLKHQTHVTPKFEADSSNIVIPMTENGCGLAFVPEKMAENSIKNGKIFKIELKEKLPNRYVTLVIKQNETPSQSVTKIYKLINKTTVK